MPSRFRAERVVACFNQVTSKWLEEGVESSPGMDLVHGVVAGIRLAPGGVVYGLHLPLILPALLARWGEVSVGSS